ncbi:Glutamine--fructose-6-phosphate aminotransferase [isomerizing] [Baekduia alba]|uniref:glutamine--fructose-6-phosphate transaminase (isomerizing) n=1 Tax=Baekduia alba TaxID=2997333 RepID=UPI0023422696|nr:glutamine--fructose-6-phosphate transaminase (isomerizing) [Baekduia alba]WCB91649.1 Glutamine--fructose-6-phosphate aminotransferase [isomerizing] [Baekduia alba]
MCGIVGYTGARPAEPLLLDGLSALEYRGYDSAGVALAHGDGSVETVRSVGNLGALRAAVAEHALAGAGTALALPDPTAGIGHTRWATHGAVTEANAHPHADGEERVHIVLNGIVENWLQLRLQLTAQGAEFTSETDAEVVAHLIGSLYEGDLGEAVDRARRRLRGHFAIAAIAYDQPGLIVGVRRECPLVVGVGEGESFVASAVAAFAAQTRRVLELADGELVRVTPEGADVVGRPGAGRQTVLVAEEQRAPDKGAFDTFMRKEISEQPDGVAATVFEHLADGDGPQLGIPDEELAGLRGVRVVACGTSYHAGLAAREIIETWAGLPVEVDVASEHRHRAAPGGDGELLIGITQSGETADTLAAMRAAQARGSRVLALTNIADSQAARDADAVLLTRAGVEIGVAATKTFTAQVAALAALGLRLSAARGALEPARRRELATELALLPDLIERAVADGDAWAARAASRFVDAPMVMFLGRQGGAAIAMEGALKLKEVSYIPSDAYPAGEMKHGPIALLSAETPVVCVATAGPLRDKLHSNMSEVRARGAHVTAVACHTDDAVASHADDVVRVPSTLPELQPLLAVVPLQLLALHVALARGLNVDQPRNLAKTVTVE